VSPSKPAKLRHTFVDRDFFLALAVATVDLADSAEGLVLVWLHAFHAPVSSKGT
jgi:hypothetical protein